MGCNNSKAVKVDEPQKTGATGSQDTFKVMQSNFTKANFDDIYQNYDFTNKLGEGWQKKNFFSTYNFIGGYGSVYKCIHKITKVPRAVKIISKEKIKDSESFQKEINIQKNLVDS